MRARWTYTERRAMQYVKNKKGQYELDDRPMRLTGKAATSALAELESGISSNPKRDEVLAECRAAVKAARERRDR